MSNPFARKLGRYVHLADIDEQALTEAFGPIRRFAPRTDIVGEGEDPNAVNVVISGWACRYKQLADGRRQIVGFLLPGDACDPHVFLLDHRDHAIEALTPVELVRIPGPGLQALTNHNPALERAFYREALAGAAIQREWMVSLGCRTGLERLAHLFCELRARLAAIGLAGHDSCPMPITQADLGQAVGQTPVHVNRTLQALRGMGLVSLRNRCLTLPDPGGLARLAQFDPTYLHFTREIVPLGAERSR